MPGISRKNTDSAGGLIYQGSGNVYVNGAGAVRIGDKIVNHNPNDSPHDSNPSMVGGSSAVFVNGIGVCRAGDNASCGHSASGSSDVIAG